MALNSPICLLLLARRLSAHEGQLSLPARAKEELTPINRVRDDRPLIELLVICPKLVEFRSRERLEDGFPSVLVRPGVGLVFRKLEYSGLRQRQILGICSCREKEKTHEERRNQDIGNSVLRTLRVSLGNEGLELFHGLDEVVQFLAFSTVGQDTVLEPGFVDVALELQCHKSCLCSFDGIFDCEVALGSDSSKYGKLGDSLWIDGYRDATKSTMRLDSGRMNVPSGGEEGSASLGASYHNAGTCDPEGRSVIVRDSTNTT